MKIAQHFTTAVALVAALAACAPTQNSRATGEYLDDSVITAKVKAKLAEDPVAKATEVQVDTFRGNVQLSGFVDSREQEQRAVEIARQVQGVTDVKDNMNLRPPPEK